MAINLMPNFHKFTNKLRKVLQIFRLLLFIIIVYFLEIQTNGIQFNWMRFD